MGGSRRSRAHLSFGRGELGCAHGISAHQALPWHRGNSRAALGPGFWGTSPSPRRRNQIQPRRQGRIRAEGVLHMLIAELALPPLGAKNTLLGHLTEVPEQSWGDGLAWGQGSGAGEGRIRTKKNQFLFPLRPQNVLGWMGPSGLSLIPAWDTFLQPRLRSRAGSGSGSSVLAAARPCQPGWGNLSRWTARRSRTNKPTNQAAAISSAPLCLLQ